MNIQNLSLLQPTRLGNLSPSRRGRIQSPFGLKEGLDLSVSSPKQRALTSRLCISVGADPSLITRPFLRRYPRSEIAKESWISCSTIKRVSPFWFISLHVAKISSVRRGANPKEGSSSNRSLGRPIMALPIESICCSPPLRVPAL